MDPTTPIVIIGLGDVGLPLAVEFGNQRPFIGFDITPVGIEGAAAVHRTRSVVWTRPCCNTP